MNSNISERRSTGPSPVQEGLRYIERLRPDRSGSRKTWYRITPCDSRRRS